MPPGTHMTSPPSCWSSNAESPNTRAPPVTYHGDGANVSRRDYLDCDMEAESSEAAKAREYFMTLWQSGEVEATELS